LVTVGFAALLLVSVFIMACSVGRERTQGTQREGEAFQSLRSVRSFAARLWTAALAMVLLMASPGFMELSSSCMMEIPALSPAVAALCVLLVGRKDKWHWREILAGILFGIGLGMKLLGLILLPIAALIIWLRVWRVTGSAGIPAGKSPNTTLGNRPARMPALPAILQFLLPRAMIQSLLIVGVATAFTFVALDWLIDRGAFLRHFQQTWVLIVTVPTLDEEQFLGANVSRLARFPVQS
jgi:hypothetical protein